MLDKETKCFPSPVKARSGRWGKYCFKKYPKMLPHLWCPVSYSLDVELSRSRPWNPGSISCLQWTKAQRTSALLSPKSPWHRLNGTSQHLTFKGGLWDANNADLCCLTLRHISKRHSLIKLPYSLHLKLKASWKLPKPIFEGRGQKDSRLGRADSIHPPTLQDAYSIFTRSNGLNMSKGSLEIPLPTVLRVAINDVVQEIWYHKCAYHGCERNKRCHTTDARQEAVLAGRNCPKCPIFPLLCS